MNDDSKKDSSSVLSPKKASDEKTEQANLDAAARDYMESQANRFLFVWGLRWQSKVVGGLTTGRIEDRKVSMSSHAQIMIPLRRCFRTCSQRT